MSFIKRRDYETAIKADDLAQIIPNELDEVLAQAEQAAIIEVQSYLRSVYDVSKIFLPLPEWSSQTAYEADYAVWFEDAIYVALSDISANGADPSANSDWELNDIRDQKILQVTIDIILFHIHKRISPRQIPQHRLIAHDMAINWLMGIRDGKMSTTLPEVEEPLSHPKIMGQERRAWYW